MRSWGRLIAGTFVVLLCAAAPAWAQRPFNWTGLYVGGYTAVGQINAKPSEGISPQPDGGAWGAQVGYNYHLSRNWVAGVELNAAFAHMEATRTFRDSPTPMELQADTVKMHAVYGVQGRLGYAMGGTLFYATAGRGWVDFETRTASTQLGSPGGPAFFTYKNINPGWLFGTGVERHLWSNWTGKLEYQYFHGEKGTITDPNGSSGYQFDMHSIRIGVNYQFR